GFEQAGFDVIAAVDIEEIHTETHINNFPNCQIWCTDLSKASGRQLRRETGIGSRQIDVVFAGPPCQGFSLIGKRLPSDPRNLLLHDLARLIVELSPSYFVVENVAGIMLPTSSTRSSPRQFTMDIILSRCQNFMNFEYTSISTPPAANPIAVFRHMGVKINFTPPTVTTGKIQYIAAHVTAPSTVNIIDMLKTDDNSCSAR